MREFKQAWEAGDINALLGLLDPDAVAIGDGGGVVTAELLPVEGRDKIAQYFVDLIVKRSGYTVLERTVNGQPGLAVVDSEGVVATVLAFDIATTTGSGTSGVSAIRRSCDPGWVDRHEPSD